MGPGRPCFKDGRNTAQIMAGIANITASSAKHEMASVLYRTTFSNMTRKCFPRTAPKSITMKESP